MAKNNQAKSSGNPAKTFNTKPVAISKIKVGSVKNGRISSESPTRPEKPVKGK
jgi:hypothetical protein